MNENPLDELFQMEEKDSVVCMRCGHQMITFQTCHLICKNCGAHLDCSDKGSVW